MWTRPMYEAMGKSNLLKMIALQPGDRETSSTASHRIDLSLISLLEHLYRKSMGFDIPGAAITTVQCCSADLLFLR